MKTALLVIATGEKYHQYIEPLLGSARKYFVPHDAIVWADTSEVIPGAFTVIEKEAFGYPGETLHRYHTLLEHEWLLRDYEQLFYIDVDMRFVAPVGEEIFSDGITATLHPGYVGTAGTPERRKESLAYIPLGTENKYFCGGFQGGNAEEFLRMSYFLQGRINLDEKQDIIAAWHDESHFNQHLFFHPPTKILSPAYCYPDVKNSYYIDKWKAAGLGELKPKILALTKDTR